MYLQTNRPAVGKAMLEKPAIYASSVYPPCSANQLSESHPERSPKFAVTSGEVEAWRAKNASRTRHAPGTLFLPNRIRKNSINAGKPGIRTSTKITRLKLFLIAGMFPK